MDGLVRQIMSVKKYEEELSSLGAQLSEMGFARKRKWIFVRDEQQGFRSQVGINVGARVRAIGEVVLSPVLAIRVDAVEELLSTLRLYPSRDPISPTVSKPLASLLPIPADTLDWVLTGDRVRNLEVIYAIGVGVESYGTRWISQMASMEAVLRQLCSVPDYRERYRCAAALKLLRRGDELRKYLVEVEESQVVRGERARTEMAHFASRVLE